MSHKNIQLTVAVVDRGVGNRAAPIFHTYDYGILLAIRGHGMASSAVMDCLRLDEPEKDLVLGLPSKSDADRLFHALGREMELYEPGHDIAFTLSLSGISLATMSALSRHEDQTVLNSRTARHKEDISMTNSHSYELVASVIRTNLSAPAIGAARKTGRQGGILIKAREVGTDAGKKLFGMTLSQEKTILLALTLADSRLPILEAICETVMKKTGEHAVAISLPVDTAEGLAG